MYLGYYLSRKKDRYLGLIWYSLDDRLLGQVNIPVVLDDVVGTYAYIQHSTSRLIGVGLIVLTLP